MNISPCTHVLLCAKYPDFAWPVASLFDNIVCATIGGISMLVILAIVARLIRIHRKRDNIPWSSLDAPNDAIAVQDCDGTILEVNRTFAKRFNSTVQGLVGTCVWDLLSPELGTSRREYVAQAISEERTVRYSDERDGMWNDVVLCPLRNSEGQVDRVVIFAHDITAQKVTERMLKESREMYHDLFEGSVDGFLCTDMDGIIVSSNSSLEDMLGYTHEELLGRRFSDITPEKWHKWEQKGVIEEQLLTRGFADPYEKEYIHKDGSIVPVELSPYLYTDTDGTAVMMWGVVRDIRDRKENQRKLEQYQSNLQSLTSQLSLSEERQRQQLASALHDGIGQSLYAMSMSAAMLRGIRDNKDRNEVLDEMVRTIDQAINDTRNLTFELCPPALYEVSLSAAIEWLAEEFEKRNEIACRVSHTKVPHALSNDARGFMFMAIRELLANVAKHANANTVDISLQEKDGMLLVTVADDGVGFDMDALSPSDEDMTRFGLFSIRTRLQALGGRLDVEATCEKSCKATLIVPIAETESKN